MELSVFKEEPRRLLEVRYGILAEGGDSYEFALRPVKVNLFRKPHHLSAFRQDLHRLLVAALVFDGQVYVRLKAAEPFKNLRLADRVGMEVDEVVVQLLHAHIEGSQYVDQWVKGIVDQGNALHSSNQLLKGLFPVSRHDCDAENTEVFQDSEVVFNKGFPVDFHEGLRIPSRQLAKPAPLSGGHYDCLHVSTLPRRTHHRFSL